MSHELLANACQLPASVDADRDQGNGGSQAASSWDEMHNPNQHTHDYQNLPEKTHVSGSENDCWKGSIFLPINYTHNMALPM